MASSRPTLLVCLLALVALAAGRASQAKAKAVEPPPSSYPDPLLLGSSAGLLFAVHACVWLMLTTLWAQAGAQAQCGAHFVSCVIGFSTLAAIGVYGWMIDPAASSLHRTRGLSDAGGWIINLMTAFQTYEVIIALIVPRLRGKHNELVVHHALTLCLAVLGGSYEYLHYYSTFFFGLSEVSSVSELRSSGVCGHVAAHHTLLALAGALDGRRLDEAVPGPPRKVSSHQRGQGHPHPSLPFVVTYPHASRLRAVEPHYLRCFLPLSPSRILAVRLIPLLER